MIASQFGLPGDTELDTGLAATASLLMALGNSSEAGGAHYAAAGIFRSAREEQRPLMVVVSCFMLPSENESTQTAVAALKQHHRNTGGVKVNLIHVPAGDAVVAQSTGVSVVDVRDESVEITNHALTAWIPHPAGDGILSIALSSNNTEDWDDIVDMAHGIFETVEWLPRKEYEE